MTPATVWIVVVAAAVGCYLLKLAGLAVPSRWVTRPPIRRALDLVPAALLAALVTVNTMTTDGVVVLDFRLAALVAAAVALWLRAPFIVVLLVAGGVGSLGYVVAG